MEVVLAEVDRVSVRRNGEVEAIIDDKARIAFAGEATNRLCPLENFAIPCVLRAKLNDPGTPGQCGAGLLYGVSRPTRVVVGEDVKAAVKLCCQECSRPGSVMSRSVIFLRSVLRLIPRIAAARI